MTRLVPHFGKALRQFVQARARVAGHRDNGFGAHLSELTDQVRPDVAGGPDDQLTGVGVQRHRRFGGQHPPLQSGHMAHAPPVDDLVFSVAVVDFLQQVPGDHSGRHRAVEINDARPRFRDVRARVCVPGPTAPRGGVGAIAFGQGWALRVTMNNFADEVPAAIAAARRRT